jgi:DNA-directed RNA polymerase specialized sigma subunit
MDSHINEIIETTVNRTVAKLVVEGLLNDDKMTTFEKTEELLRNYNKLRQSEHGSMTRKVIKKINDALESIKNDPYAEAIRLFYIEGKTREYVALELNTTPTTISRNKTRLVNEIKVMLFSDDFIKEIYS